MKRLIFCLFVLISAAAISNLMACGIANKKAPSVDAQTYTGPYTEDSWGYCWDEYGNYCPECPKELWWYPECGTSPAILIDGTKYSFNGVSEKEIAEMKLKEGEVITISGILFSEDCVNYIDVVSIKKQKLAIGDAQAAPASLDLQQPMYNMLGVPVDETYKGVVIQNGIKCVIY